MRVGSLVSKLRLESCQDTYVGNVLVKGISGGERKRTSIGYELITNPSCLLLDEPTSGLDSSTALQVIGLLKNEARRGMSILATIHQPSSELFQKLDRVILLADGRLIYNDKSNKVADYFKKLADVQLGRYVNPADYLLKLANQPSSISKDLNFESVYART